MIDFFADFECTDQILSHANCRHKVEENEKRSPGSHLAPGQEKGGKQSSAASVTNLAISQPTVH